MSTWRWQPCKGTYIAEHKEPRECGPVCTTIDEAYNLAESWWADGARHVAILLYAPTNLNPGVADTRDRDKFEGAWVVGRERWRQNEAKAVKEGRA